MASGGVRVMEKPPIQLQQQPQPQPQSQEALKCPRCDSSNTKFCYYNNYSLSQPRHFCKACKRYWTRGGTLRNVPVGGGCRKNKRVKRPITTNTPPPPPPANHHQTNPNPNPNPDHNNQIIPSSSATSNSNLSNHHLNPLFYGLLPQNPNYPRFDSTSIISETAGSLVSGGYDLLQPHHINAGLGFSGTLVAANNHGHIDSNSTFSSYMNVSVPPPMYAGGSASSMASLLASSLTSQQQRFMGFASYDDDGHSNSMVVKDLKVEEETQNRRSMDQQWNNNSFHGRNNKNDDDHHHQQQQMEADPNSLLWDSRTAVDQGGVLWPNNDPTNNNIGSSVPSLI